MEDPTVSSQQLQSQEEQRSRKRAISKQKQTANRSTIHQADESERHNKDDEPLKTKRTKYNRQAVSDSSEDEELQCSQKPVTSVYEVRPIRGLFSVQDDLAHFMNDMASAMKEKRPDLPSILRCAADVRALKTKINKLPLRKLHFTQFSYKTPIRMIVVSNMYGAFVNTLDAFNERKKIFDVAQLEPKHRVSMLLPSVDHWWHDQSKELMCEFMNSKFVNDLKILSTREEFTEAVQKFKINDAGQCWKNLKAKILTAKKETNDGKVPGVFNVRIPNTQGLPSKISIQLTRFGDSDMQGSNVTWKKLLLEPTYIHGLAVISIAGFKITRTGMSLDMEMEFLSYSTIPVELQRSINYKQKQENVIVNNKWFKNSAPESSDDDNDDNSDVASKSQGFRPSYNFD